MVSALVRYPCWESPREERAVNRPHGPGCATTGHSGSYLAVCFFLGHATVDSDCWLSSLPWHVYAPVPPDHMLYPCAQ